MVWHRYNMMIFKLMEILPFCKFIRTRFCIIVSSHYLRESKDYLTLLVANPCYARNVSGGVNPPPPRINRSDHLFTRKWKLTVDPLPINHQSAPPPQINRGDDLFTQKWKLTVDPLCVDCQSPPPWSTQKLLSQNDHAFWHMCQLYIL